MKSANASSKQDLTGSTSSINTLARRLVDDFNQRIYNREGPVMFLATTSLTFDLADVYITFLQSTILLGGDRGP